jgi:hypothetical protein
MDEPPDMEGVEDAMDGWPGGRESAESGRPGREVASVEAAVRLATGAGSSLGVCSTRMSESSLREQAVRRKTAAAARTRFKPRRDTSGGKWKMEKEFYHEDAKNTKEGKREEINRSAGRQNAEERRFKRRREGKRKMKKRFLRENLKGKIIQVLNLKRATSPSWKR